jgi:hypothetical protein
MWYFFACWLFYSALSGVKDAILYSGKTQSPFGFNEHQIWVVERLSVLMIVLGGLFFSLDDLQYVRVFFSCLLCFPFIHNGYYYETRSRLDVPSYNWFSHSKETTAKINLNWFQRTAMFIVGIINLLY